MDDLERGYVDKKDILKYVTEEDIFKLVFKDIPDEFEYITSPFREDNNPGCWFQRGTKGDLRFVDFGNRNVYRGINMLNIDCFNAVQVYFNLPNFYKTLEFIFSSLILGNKDKIESAIVRNDFVAFIPKPSFRLEINTREFQAKDGRFWSKFGISRQNLIDDKVFPVSSYRMFNTKSGDLTLRPREVCYAFTNFKNRHKKLYFPYQKGKGRFITNCKEDDIGELESLPQTGDLLIISKSYKDCRVIRNMAYNSIWLQGEGMFPSNSLLISLCNRFKEVIVFFDNDKTGITLAARLVELINTFLPNKARSIVLPDFIGNQKIKDPGDTYEKVGLKHLEEFFKNNI